MFLDIIVFIVILAFLVLAHEAGHFFTARLFGMYIEEFAIGFPPRIFSKKRGETTYAIGVVPLGGYVKIPGENGKEALDTEREHAEEAQGLNDQKIDIPESRYFYSKPIWQRSIVLIAGVCANFLIGWIFLATVYMVGVPGGVMITAVSANSPAARVGLQAGDIIRGYETSEVFIEAAREHRGKNFMFEIQRGKDTVRIEAVPRLESPQGEGVLGVQVQDGGIEKKGFFEAIGKSWVRAWELFAMIFVLIARLCASIVSGEDIFSQLAGPIGIFNVTAQATDLGFVYLAHLIALISLNLAALNIFPFPALDGGRLLFVILEKIKGSPIRMKTQALFNGVGFVILILFLIAVSIQDIRRLF